MLVQFPWKQKDILMLKISNIYNFEVLFNIRKVISQHYISGPTLVTNILPFKKKLIYLKKDFHLTQNLESELCNVYRQSDQLLTST